MPLALNLRSLGCLSLGCGGSLASDLFTAGAALFPLGIAILIGGLRGFGDLVGLLVLFAMCYHVLLLYAGLTQLGGLTERTGAPAVPVLIVLAAWLSKIVFVAML